MCGGGARGPDEPGGRGQGRRRRETSGPNGSSGGVRGAEGAGKDRPAPRCSGAGGRGGGKGSPPAGCHFPARLYSRWSPAWRARSRPPPPDGRPARPAHPAARGRAHLPAGAATARALSRRGSAREGWGGGGRAGAARRGPSAVPAPRTPPPCPSALFISPPPPHPVGRGKKIETYTFVRPTGVTLRADVTRV